MMVAPSALRKHPLVAAMLVVAFATGGCLEPSAGNVAGSVAYPAEQPPPTVISVTYLSGHLGRYDTCSEEAIPPTGLANDVPKRDGSARGDGDCLHASVALRLSNEGDVALDGSKVSKIDLLVAPNDFLLPTEVLDIEVLDGVGLGEPLPPGDYIEFRVTFRGVAGWVDYTDAFNKPGPDFHRASVPGDGSYINEAKIRVVLTSGETREVVVTPVLIPLPDSYTNARSRRRD